MRIGELLLAHRKVRPSDLQKCLDEQATQKRRLVSLLIRAGALEFDDGSRALGEQFGMPCVLAKHLAARDPMLAFKIPTELARIRCALPIGRSKGVLLVCVREPSAELHKQIEKLTRGEVMLVVSPALRLEGLVEDAFGPAPPEEFDVLLDSAVDLIPAPEVPSTPASRTHTLELELDPILPPEPPMPDMSALDPESVRLSLTDLDDARVTKDPMQSAIAPTPKTGPRPTLPPRPVTEAPPVAIPQKFVRVDTQPGMPVTGKRPKVPPPPTISATSEALELAPTRDDATEAAARFMTGHWNAWLALAIRDEAAIGYRGHGASIGTVEGLVVPLLTPSTVQKAVETKRTAIVPHASSTQDELVRRLGSQMPAAAPVLVQGNVVAVLVVGDPIDGRFKDEEAATAELGRLAQLLGTAWARVMGSR